MLYIQLKDKLLRLLNMDNEFVYGVSSIDGVTITPLKVNPLTGGISIDNLQNSVDWCYLPIGWNAAWLNAKANNQTAPASTNPTKWIPVNDNGTTRYIPAW
jgi:hypothetical protein